MPFDPNKPYNDLPKLPPAKTIETHAVLKKAISANRALAELRGAGHMIPNQAVIIQAIGLQEARLSSEIENIVTTNDDLYRAFADDTLKTDPQTKEVLSYKDAIWHGYNAIVKKKRLLTTPLFEEIVQIIKGHTAEIRKTPGTKLTNSKGETIYTPPEGEAIIRKKLANLEEFFHSNKHLDPLVKLAIAHYQFEAIHPFTDGNGRTGRIINVLFLIDQGLLDIPVLYLSRYIVKNKTPYYKGLLNVTIHEAWEEWVLYLLNGIEETALLTKERILDIQRLFLETAEHVREKLPRIYSKDLLEILFRQPYCKIRFLEEAGIAQRQTASSYLQQLERVGVLKRIKIGRDVYYINQPFLNILKL
jgi:Fic family protein